MTAHDPLAVLDTHEVANQPPDLPEGDLFADDAALAEAVRREGAGAHGETLASMGRAAGSAEVREWGRLANRYPPELSTFDPQGRRIDEVAFHPAYHQLMSLAVGHGVASVAWTAETGGHVAHGALQYLFTQAEAGVCCPMAMTYAVIPVLEKAPGLAGDWAKGLLSAEYDSRAIPRAGKTGLTAGMALTEKQGGSDLRSNEARAVPMSGGGSEYLLTGHKWFCSAPMSDAFMVLAKTDQGPSCFLLPRFRPDGTRNRFFIQRLKDKLGNRSNASAEVEFKDALAFPVGEEGRGIATVMEMVHHTRLDCTIAPAGMMRQAVLLARHHASHRRAFQRRLIDQPLMENLLADMAIEWEAATGLAFRVAGAYDRAGADEGEGRFARLAVAVAKYWVNKRLPTVVTEAMEILGGGGYVEESPLPRLYREAPVNSIWEGSGNVICLDVLRTLVSDAEAADLYVAELEHARGADPHLDRTIDGLKADLAGGPGGEVEARRLTERMALALQGALLHRHGPQAVADTFSATRLAGDWGGALGTLPAGTDFRAVAARAA